MVGSSTSIALIVGRWGSWPGWTPLLLRSFGANPSVDFYLLSDVHPTARSALPPNVIHVPLTVAQLLLRLQTYVGCKLTTLSASGTYGSGVSSAKTNDFKPMWGVAFADLLRPYAWWGYLQEDLVVGNLRAFATETLLAQHDVLSPYLPPLNASGVLMLFRNTHTINRLWNRSRVASRVLRSPKYLVFDEWWGPLEKDDNFARVLGREAAKGRIRLKLASVRRRWMGDDKRYPILAGQSVTTNMDFVACWHRGQLWVNVAGQRTPCTSAFDDRARSKAQHASEQQRPGGIAPPEMAQEVALVHLSRVKRLPALASLRLDGLRHTAQRADSFVITSNGVWLSEPNAFCEDSPAFANKHRLGCVGYEAEGHCKGGRVVTGHEEWASGAQSGSPERHCCACGKHNTTRRRSSSASASASSGGPRRHYWASGLQADPHARASVDGTLLAGYLKKLEARDAAARCNPKHRTRDPTLCARKAASAGLAGPAPQPPCVVVTHSISIVKGSAAAAGTTSELATLSHAAALGTEPCPKRP